MHTIEQWKPLRHVGEVAICRGLKGFPHGDVWNILPKSELKLMTYAFLGLQIVGVQPRCSQGFHTRDVGPSTDIADDAEMIGRIISEYTVDVATEYIPS